MTREEYVQWCKDRAMEYVKRGDLLNGITSMMSDMDKREDTKLGDTLSALGMMVAMKRDPREAERFITGFN